MTIFSNKKRIFPLSKIKKNCLSVVQQTKMLSHSCWTNRRLLKCHCSSHLDLMVFFSSFLFHFKPSSYLYVSIIHVNIRFLSGKFNFYKNQFKWELHQIENIQCCIDSFFFYFSFIYLIIKYWIVDDPKLMYKFE